MTHNAAIGFFKKHGKTHPVMARKGIRLVKQIRATDVPHHSPLTSAARRALPSSSFVFPSERRYPIPDAAHARNALSRVSRFGTPKEKRAVCRAVSRRFPSIHAESCKLH